MYWNQIVKLHEGLLKRGACFYMFQFTTNGTLITDEQVNKLNSWGAMVIISNHEDYGIPKWKVLSKIKKCAISFFFTHQKTHIWSFYDLIDRLIISENRLFTPMMHWVRSTKTCNVNHHFTMKDLVEHEKHLFELADLRLKGHMLSNHLFEGHLITYKKNKFEKQNDVVVEQRCFGSKSVSIDLLGNIYTCQHDVSIENQIRTGYSLIQTPKQKEIEINSSKFINSNECKLCELKTFCKGNCHLSLTHDVDCALSKIKAKVFNYIIDNEQI